MGSNIIYRVCVQTWCPSLAEDFKDSSETVTNASRKNELMKRLPAPVKVYLCFKSDQLNKNKCKTQMNLSAFCWRKKQLAVI